MATNSVLCTVSLSSNCTDVLTLPSTLVSCIHKYSLVFYSFSMKLEMKLSGDQSSELEFVDRDYTEELKAFDNTKAGVKGLVDAGVRSIPRIFVKPTDDYDLKLNMQVPVINLEGIKVAKRRNEIVSEIKTAAEKWGFFQLVNHSIPGGVLTEMIDGVARFNDLEVEKKKVFYTRDKTKSVCFNSNYDLFKGKTANWRDTMTVSVSDQLKPTELPVACREATFEYSKHVRQLGELLFELLSEALGLEPNHLNKLECANTCRFAYHYYPACPEPKRTMGCSKHTDPGFLTILLQNQISGLQILHEDHWIDVTPISGGLAVNIGDLLQLTTNDKFRSVEHRVVANLVGPRISVACFFSGPIHAPKVYGPIIELISEENPPLYRKILLSEYVTNFYSRGLEDKLNLDYYRF